MDDKKIIIPKTYEEAIKRKEEVLALINDYNEAYFKGEEPLISEEAMSLLQEEFLILNDIVIDKPVDNDIESDDKEKKINILEKINPLIWIYTFIIFTFSSWFMIEYVGNEIFKFIFTKNWIQDYDNKFLIIMVIIWSFYAFPLLIFSLNFLVKLFFKKNPLNHKAFWWVIVAHFVYLIINFCYIYFDKLHPIVKQITAL